MKFKYTKDNPPTCYDEALEACQERKWKINETWKGYKIGRYKKVYFFLCDGVVELIKRVDENV